MLIDLKGPYFTPGKPIPDWLMWFVKTIGRVEVHNNPHVQRLVLQDDLKNSRGVMWPDFVLMVYGKCWGPHLDEVQTKLMEMGSSVTFRYEQIIQARQSNEPDLIIRMACSLIQSYSREMLDLQLVVRDR